MKLQFIIALSTVSIFFSCEETTTIDTGQAPDRFVIEGLVTNELKRHSVKITRTVDFYQTGRTPKVSGARVTVIENNTTEFMFEETEPGLYQPVSEFQGIEGNIYDLRVEVEDQLFTASETLLPVTTIDSLTFELSDEENDDGEQIGYSIFLFTKEPQEEDNYYLFKFYRNGEVLNEDGEDITVTDDTAVRESIDGIEAPYLYLLGDTARVEMYSLTRTSFLFWSDVATLIFSDGGVFAPLPANPRSNITGGALGVFQVSALAADDIIIE